MENKKSKKIVSIVILLVIVLLVIIAVVLSIVLRNNPEKTIDTVFTGLKEGNYEVLNDYVSNNLTDSVGNEIGNEISTQEISDETKAKAEGLVAECFSQLDWKIQDSKVEGDTATVTVEVTNKDFTNIVQDIFTELIGKAFAAAFSGGEISEDEVIDSLKSKIESTTDTKTNTGDIKLIKQDNVWKIDDENIVTLLFPGLKEKIESLQQSFNSLNSLDSIESNFNDSGL